MEFWIGKASGKWRLPLLWLISKEQCLRHSSTKVHPEYLLQTHVHLLCVKHPAFVVEKVPFFILCPARHHLPPHVSQLGTSWLSPPIPKKIGVPFQTAWNFGPQRINMNQRDQKVTFLWVSYPAAQGTPCPITWGSASGWDCLLFLDFLSLPRLGLPQSIHLRRHGWKFKASHMVGLSIPWFFVGDHAIYDLHSFWWSHVGSSSYMRMTISRSKSRFGSIL